MARTKTYTEEQISELVYSQNVVKEIKGEDRRWSRTNEVVFKDPDDGNYYRTFWEEGLTEMQEDTFYETTCSQVFPQTRIHAEVVTDYLTEEELAEDDAEGDGAARSDLDSLKIVAAEQTVQDAFTEDKVSDAEQALELFGKLGILDDVADFGAFRAAAEKYLEKYIRLAAQEAGADDE